MNWRQYLQRHCFTHWRRDAGIEPTRKTSSRETVLKTADHTSDRISPRAANSIKRPRGWVAACGSRSGRPRDRGEVRRVHRLPESRRDPAPDPRSADSLCSFAGEQSHVRKLRAAVKFAIADSDDVSQPGQRVRGKDLRRRHKAQTSSKARPSPCGRRHPACGGCAHHGQSRPSGRLAA